MPIDMHDLLAAERFLAAEARIAALFEYVEEQIAPLLRAMRATGRITYATDPEHGAIWGHAFLRPPYAPSVEAEWFLAWGLRFPDGGVGWEGADPALPRGIHAVAALGTLSDIRPRLNAADRDRLVPGWSVVRGSAVLLVAALPLSGLLPEPSATTETLAEWTLTRLDELRVVLPELAGA